ncbi:MAG TPA: hypothetical protein PLA31_02390 [Clostridia bacterium]|jgi:ribosomal protein L16 Arg81 hydroxylase|nr:hypothetical protein [Clostridia bacterium]
MTNETMRAKLVDAANLLKDLTMAVVAIAEEFGEVKVEEKSSPDEPKETAPAETGPTLEEVRAVLAEISRAGKTSEMKALLSEFGASRLSDVDPGQYGALMEKAREVQNA